MQVAKWGKSSAVRLPAAVVDALTLKEGDEMEVQVVGSRVLRSKKRPQARELLALSGNSAGDFLPISSSTVLKPMSAAERFLIRMFCSTCCPRDDTKANRAENDLSAGGILSVQVLNEFASVASRKLKMSIADIREMLSTIRTVCKVVPVGKNPRTWVCRSPKDTRCPCMTQ